MPLKIVICKLESQMLKTKILVTSFLTAATTIGLVACGNNSNNPTSTPKPDPVTISLLGINDFRGNLLPPSGSVTVASSTNPSGTRVSAGGIAYLASLVNELKAQNPNNTLVVGAGDLIGGTPIYSALFHDESTIEALNQLGLDISAVGNHEFDKGRDELLRMQNGGCFPKTSNSGSGNIGVDTCMTDGKFVGAKFKFLAANVIDQKTGSPLFAPYVIQTIKGANIAFIGLTLKDTPAQVSPSGTLGLSFNDEVETVNRLIPELKAKGAMSVVVLLHQGGFTTASTVNDKTCPGLNGDILSLVDKFDPAVDVVISGHTQQEYNCTRPDGRLLTQAGFNGRIVSKIDITIDTTQKKVISKSANNIVAINDVGVKDATGALIPLPTGMKVQVKDAAMSALIQRYVDLTAPITNATIGNLTAPVSRTANTAGESKMGDLVSDIYLAGSSGAAYGNKAAQIAFVNTGGIRSDLTTSLPVSYGQLFSVMPFGNNLTTMDLTGTQILRLLEQQWEAPQPATGRVMQISSGFTYTWDASTAAVAAAGTGNRVVANSMKLNGTPIDLNKTYRVTVNNFMATGGDNFTVLRSGTNVQQGDVDIDAGVAYFRKLGTVPAPAQDRIVRIN
jgi:5'-nucleotidase